MDIQQIINTVVSKLQVDPAVLSQFVADPVKTLEKVFNVDLPDEQINQVIEGIKGQLDPSKLDVSKVGGFLNTLKNLLGK